MAIMRADGSAVPGKVDDTRYSGTTKRRRVEYRLV